jgi:hypothetical protein
MAKMTLGTCTFTRNPSEMTVIKADRICASEPTYAGVAFYSWGPSLIGKEIELYWPAMPIEQFNDLQEIYEADASVVFDPQDDSSDTFNVQVLDFNGKYHITPTVNENGGKRKDVRMVLLIMSEAS